jgi:hypothetical protein
MTTMTTSAFVGTNPTGELITSGLPVTRGQSSGMSTNQIWGPSRPTVVHWQVHIGNNSHAFRR